MPTQLRTLAAATAIATLATAAVGATQLSASASAACSPNAVTTFVPPASTDDPFGVTAGPDHATYVAHGATIDKFKNGHVTAFPVPHAGNADIGWLAWRGRPAPRIWFADRAGRLGRMSATGAVSEVRIPPKGSTAAAPQSIVFAPNGAVWFTDQANSRIGRYTPKTRSFRFYRVPSPDATPLGMVRGRDGDLYFTERSAHPKAGRLDPRTGLFTEWTLPKGGFPNRLTADAQGNVWFTDLGTNTLDRITPHGHLARMPLAGAPVGIIGHDGFLYTALNSAHRLAQLDASGHETRSWVLPHAAGVLQLAASNGFIWVADGFANHVYRVRVSC